MEQKTNLYFAMSAMSLCGSILARELLSALRVTLTRVVSWGGMDCVKSGISISVKLFFTTIEPLSFI